MNDVAADVVYRKGRELFQAEEYAQAYDEFSKAYEISKDPALMFDRAQALRLMGGRRAEAMALFEQFLTMQIDDDQRKAGRVHLDDLRGTGKRAGSGGSQAAP